MDCRRLKIVLAIIQQPISGFQRNFALGSSFSQNFGNGADTRVPQIVFFGFSNAIWASASGGFHIVSDTLIYCLIHDYYCWFTNPAVVLMFVYLDDMFTHYSGGHINVSRRKTVHRT